MTEYRFYGTAQPLAVPPFTNSKQTKARESSSYWGEDGSLVINSRLRAESRALILKALEAAVDEGNEQAFSGYPVTDTENVPAGTLLPEWQGETMDMGMAVEDMLLAEEKRRLSRPAY